MTFILLSTVPLTVPLLLVFVLVLLLLLLGSVCVVFVGEDRGIRAATLFLVMAFQLFVR